MAKMAEQQKIAAAPSKSPIGALATLPSEVARETIKRMASERIPPTPEHYLRIYNQIAQIPQTETLILALSKALKTLQNDTTEHTKWIKSWDKLVVDADYSALPELLSSGMSTKVAESKLWPDTIRVLLKTWSSHQAGLTQQQKKESLERVLINFGKDPQLPQKIQTMTKSWSEYSNSSGVSLASMVDEVVETSALEISVLETSSKPLSLIAFKNETDAVALSGDTEGFNEAFKTLQSLLLESLKYGLVVRLDGYPDLKTEAQDIFASVEKAKKLIEWQMIASQFKHLLVRVRLIDSEEDAIKNELLGLLKLLIENISELVSDDKWLQGQISVIKTIIASPLEKALIQDAQRSLKEVIFRQGTLKHSLSEAKQSFKQMITMFVQRLGMMSDSTGSYQNKIEGYSKKLSITDDITQISSIVESLMLDTRMVQADIVRSREDLLKQQEIAKAAEEKIRTLELELNNLSEKVRIDQLTGVLNRRGLDDAFIREFSWAQRGKNNLSVMLLDIDNFKQFNDTYGHDVGDKVLQHLASAVKQCVRPIDVVARYGGEEFVILLPNTAIENAVEAGIRLQRELTKKFFMHNNKRLLVSFSAGVALYRAGEDQSAVIQRADKAMYRAKERGKNRVISEND